MLVFAEGFDFSGTGGLSTQWTSVSGGGVDCAPAYGRYGEGGIRFTDNAEVTKTIPALDSYLVGFSMSLSSAVGTSFDRYLCAFRDGSSYQMELAFNHTDRTLYLLRNGSFVAGSTLTVPVDAWVYVEWLVTISDSCPSGSNVVRVDGVDWIDVASGTDTRDGAATVSTLSLGVVSGGAVLSPGFNYSDLYLLDATGSDHNTFLGPSRVRSGVVGPIDLGGVDYDVSAATGVDVGTGTSHLVGGTVSVSAATGVKIGAASYGHVQHDWVVSAATAFDAGTGTYRHVAQNFFVSASSGVDVAAASLIVRVGPNVFVAVRTGIDLIRTPAFTVYVTQNYEVSAATRFEAGVSLRAVRVFDVSAATRFEAGGQASVYNTSKPASGRTGFDVFMPHPSPSFNRTYRVSAGTRFEGGAEAGGVAPTARFASAGTAVRVSHAGSKTRDGVARATTALFAGAVAVKVGRDVFASARTEMGLALTDATNQNPHESRATAFVLYVQAGVVGVAGTPAETGIVLTHLAEAGVSLPWRRGTLSLPSGGQIPH